MKRLALDRPRPVVWDGDYVKSEYLVHLPGECVVCWPNAGLMNSMDGSGRSWEPDGALHISRLDGRAQMEDRWPLKTTGPFWVWWADPEYRRVVEAAYQQADNSAGARLQRERKRAKRARKRR